MYHGCRFGGVRVIEAYFRPFVSKKSYKLVLEIDGKEKKPEVCQDSWLAKNWPSWGRKTDPVVVFDIIRMPAMAVWNGKPLDAFYWFAFFAEWLSCQLVFARFFLHVFFSDMG